MVICVVLFAMVAPTLAETPQAQTTDKPPVAAVSATEEFKVANASGIDTPSLKAKVESLAPEVASPAPEAKDANLAVSLVPDAKVGSTPPDAAPEATGASPVQDANGPAQEARVQTIQSPPPEIASSSPEGTSNGFAPDPSAAGPAPLPSTATEAKVESPEAISSAQGDKFHDIAAESAAAKFGTAFDTKVESRAPDSKNGSSEGAASLVSRAKDESPIIEAANPAPSAKNLSSAIDVASSASKAKDESPIIEAANPALNAKNLSSAIDVASSASKAEVGSPASEAAHAAPAAKVDGLATSTDFSSAPEAGVKNPTSQEASSAPEAKGAIPDAASAAPEAVRPTPEAEVQHRPQKAASPAQDAKVAGLDPESIAPGPVPGAKDVSPPEDTDASLESWLMEEYSHVGPLHCQTVDVGKAETNNKTITLPRKGMTCTGTPRNPQLPDWTDRFSASVSGRQLKVTRTDDITEGWGQFLQLKCCDPPEAGLIVGIPQPAPSILTTPAPTVPLEAAVEVSHEFQHAEYKGVYFQKTDEDLKNHEAFGWHWLLLFIGVAIIVSFARLVFLKTGHFLRKRSAAPKKIDVEPHDIDIEANMERSATTKMSMAVKPGISRTSIVKTSTEESSISCSGWDAWEDDDEEWGEGWGDVDDPFDHESAFDNLQLSVSEAKAVDMFSCQTQRSMKGKAD